MNKNVIIAPSLLSADVLHLADEIDHVTHAGADWLHLDIMDGHFVPNLSYGPAFVQQVKSYTKLPVDVHLMISPIDLIIDAFIKACPDRLTIHPEADFHPYRVLQKIRSAGLSAGIALNPGTSMDRILPLLDLVDLVLVMTVNPGFGGQEFITSGLDKIIQLKQHILKHHPHIKIEVDGGINNHTAQSIIAAGADVLVAGSYIFDTPSKTVDTYRQKIEALR